MITLFRDALLFTKHERTQDVNVGENPPGVGSDSPRNESPRSPGANPPGASRVGSLEIDDPALAVLVGFLFAMDVVENPPREV